MVPGLQPPGRRGSGHLPAHFPRWPGADAGAPGRQPRVAVMITKVPGFQVGHASDFKNLTGCTVVLCPPGTVGSADVRGSSAGTRQMDTLVKYHLVTEVHAVLISGG